MTHTAVVRVASDAVLPGELPTALPVTYMEAQQTVPIAEGPLPLLWVCAPDHAAVQQQLATNSAVVAVAPLDHDGEYRLYRIDWREAGPAINCFAAVDATVVEAVGDATDWQFTLRLDATAIEQLYERCRDRDLDLTLERITDDTAVSDTGHLSQEQYEILALACKRGYFDVPRACTLGELADELGLSDQAASTRLRRGLRSYLTHRLPWG
jgi:predicted DNA binding protein